MERTDLSKYTKNRERINNEINVHRKGMNKDEESNKENKKLT